MNEFIDNFKSILQTKYALFIGRARRKEFWQFQVVAFAISIVLMIVDGILGTKTASGIGILGGIFSLAILLPNIGVLIRRLHDTDRSGWWALLGLIPIANIALLVFMFIQGTVGSNRFGPDPKALGN